MYVCVDELVFHRLYYVTRARKLDDSRPSFPGLENSARLGNFFNLLLSRGGGRATSESVCLTRGESIVGKFAERPKDHLPLIKLFLRPGTL